MRLKVISVGSLLPKESQEMFKLLANLATHRPWLVVICAMLFGVVAIMLGGRVAGTMTNGSDDFEDPSSESVLARERLAEVADTRPDVDVVALVRTKEYVRTPEARTKIENVARKIARDPAVARVVTTYNVQNPTMISTDGRATYVLASFRPVRESDEAVQRLQNEFASNPDVALGGEAVIGPQVGQTVGSDLARAELLAFPILFILSLWIFRGLVAAILPLLVGGLAAVGTFLGLSIVTEVVPLSIFALNLVTGLGLGLPSTTAFSSSLATGRRCHA